MVEHTFQSLVGKKLLAIHLTVGDHGIKFVTDGGDFYFDCSGDCCSSPYINSIQGVKDALGEEILAVSEDPHENFPEGQRDDYCTTAMFYNIATRKGRVSIDFRVDSNGYYGGALVPENIPDGLVFRPLLDDLNP